jgi:diguanylate cyclase (GGDEF)-like protein
MGAISSTLGHSAGDDLIRLAAKHLRINIDRGEVLSHLGGDQFILIIPGAETDGALECAEKIHGILAAGVTLENVNISLQSEIGIAGYPEHADSAASLLRNAAIARSEAHTRGEPVMIFMRGREDDYVRRLHIVNDLRGAFHREEVQVWYQSKVALLDGNPSGAEALVRWQHPEYGWLPPDEFVPAAEEAGTIIHLTRYVLKQAIAECRNWKTSGYSMQVSVNISARDLCDDYLPYYVLQLLKEHDLEPQRLTLEVTENSVIQQLRRAITVLECLRDIGVRISMDDFGTGQSSLTQLKNIPLNELKIDKSFVINLATDKQNEAIVRATIELAHSLGIDVVAEGVEDEYSLRFLSGAGCEEAQGYFFSKPVPSRKFLNWLAGYKPASYGERRAQQRPFRKKA